VALKNQVISAAVPAPVANRLRALATADDRSTSYVIRLVLQRGLASLDDGTENADGASQGAARQDRREGRRDATG
jgi:hypothetical protein